MYSTNNTSYQYGRLRIHMYIDSSYRIYLGKKKKEIKIIKNKSFFILFFLIISSAVFWPKLSDRTTACNINLDPAERRITADEKEYKSELQFALQKTKPELLVTEWCHTSIRSIIIYFNLTYF